MESSDIIIRTPPLPGLPETTDLTPFFAVCADLQADSIARGEALLASLDFIEVCDDASYESTTKLARETKADIASVESKIGNAKRQASALHKFIVNIENESTRRQSEALEILEVRLVDYRKAQEKIRQESERLERERLAKEAEATKAAELKRLQDEAEKAMQTGDLEGEEEARAAAIELAATPVFVRPVVAARNVPALKGVAGRTNWKFEVTDADKLPREYLMPDLMAIGAIVRLRKGATNIPGVRPYPDDKITLRNPQ